MLTTLEIPDAIFKQVKRRATETGTPMKVILTRALQLELGAGAAAATAAKPWQVPVAPHALNDHGYDWEKIKAILNNEMDTVDIAKINGGHAR